MRVRIIIDLIYLLINHHFNGSVYLFSCSWICCKQQSHIFHFAKHFLRRNLFAAMDFQMSSDVMPIRWSPVNFGQTILVWNVHTFLADIRLWAKFKHSLGSYCIRLTQSGKCGIVAIFFDEAHILFLDTNCRRIYLGSVHWKLWTIKHWLFLF